MMKALISDVFKGSIAEELEIKKGDAIIKVNGKDVSDLIEFNFEICCEFLTIEVLKSTGEIEVLEIEKDFDEDLGVVFESAVFDGIKRCLNNCIFCFVDQQPENMRKTLYIKDDDWRLSYLQGTYVTMTNFKEEDKKRISNLHLGPLYVSVHTTNPDLRVKMLKNPNAAKIMSDLKWLKENNIPIHAQIVLCPGYNDSKELSRTLNDLWNFRKIIKSVAIVPLGVTKFRSFPLQKVDFNCAKETIKIVNDFNSEKKKFFAQASDEFFIMTESSLPEKKYYKDFGQIDDGVGISRLVLDDFEKRKRSLPKKIEKKKVFHFILSKSAFYVFKKIVSTLNEIENLKIVPLVVNQNFFGEDVNVSGLITSKDIESTLKDQKGLNIVLPSVMFKPMSRTFLDDVELEVLAQKLQSRFFVVEDIYSVKDLFKIILS